MCRKRSKTAIVTGGSPRTGRACVERLGHMGEPDDIAWAVVYLASEEAKFATGAELVVDGGYTGR